MAKLLDPHSLAKFDKIVVLANTQLGSPLAIGPTDLLVIFNVPLSLARVSGKKNILWVHRSVGESDRYFGCPNIIDVKALGHTCISSRRTRPRFLPSWCSEVIYGLGELEADKAYPVGARVWLTKSSPRHIESPSTGYVVLSILDQHIKDGHPLSVDAVGFGSLPNGWKGHAWAYERRSIARMHVRLLDRHLRPARFTWLTGLCPDVLIRVANDVWQMLRRTLFHGGIF